jgi:O-antigen ligase
MTNTFKKIGIYQCFVVIIALITSFLILYPSEKILISIAVLLSLPLFIATILLSFKKASSVIDEVQTIHISWILLLISLLLFKSRTGQEIVENPVEAQQLLRIIPLLMAGCLAFFYLIKTKRLFLIFRGPLFMFLFYCLSSLISIIYSSYFIYSAWKALELFICFMVIASIMSSYKNAEYLRTINNLNFAWNNLLIITIIFGALILPQFAFQNPTGAILPQIQGVYPVINPNSVGLMSAIAILLMLSKILDEKSKPLIYIFAGLLFLVILIFAQSRTSIIGVILSLSIYILLKRKIKIIVIKIAIVLVIIAAIGDVALNLISSYGLRGKTLESIQITTLSGRTQGWEEGWKQFKNSPVLGYGFASGARYDVLEKIGRESQGAMHNAFLDVLVNNGIIGFIPWIIAYVWALIILFKRSLNNLEDNTAPLFVSILILFGVRMTTGDSLVYHDYSTLFYLGILAYAQLLYLGE